jgi:hypothetical protein
MITQLQIEKLVFHKISIKRKSYIYAIIETAQELHIPFSVVLDAIPKRMRNKNKKEVLEIYS